MHKEGSHLPIFLGFLFLLSFLSLVLRRCEHWCIICWCMTQKFFSTFYSLFSEFLLMSLCSELIIRNFLFVFRLSFAVSDYLVVVHCLVPSKSRLPVLCFRYSHSTELASNFRWERIFLLWNIWLLLLCLRLLCGTRPGGAPPGSFSENLQIHVQALVLLSLRYSQSWNVMIRPQFWILSGYVDEHAPISVAMGINFPMVGEPMTAEPP